MSFTVGITYTYSVIRRNVDINDDKIVIYYDPDTSCPNHNMPCNIPSHGRLVPDWATQVNFWAFYDLQISRRIDLGLRLYYLNKEYTVNDAGFSTSRKFYRGRMFDHYVTIDLGY